MSQLVEEERKEQPKKKAPTKDSKPPRNKSTSQSIATSKQQAEKPDVIPEAKGPGGDCDIDEFNEIDESFLSSQALS